MERAPLCDQQILNRVVGRNVCCWSSYHTVTSDVYKDNQRRDVYTIIETIDSRIKSKCCFMIIEQRMFRVPNKEVAVLALFFMVFEFNFDINDHQFGQ